jgi:hypothetical protein
MFRFKASYIIIKQLPASFNILNPFLNTPYQYTHKQNTSILPLTFQVNNPITIINSVPGFWRLPLATQTV